MSKPSYKDVGCELYPTCAECSLSECAITQYGSIGKYKKAKRNEEILGLLGEGKTAKELASIFNLTVRTIERVLKRGSN